MNIIQNFYDNLASKYDKLFEDWEATTKEQAVILDRIFLDNGFTKEARVLDCACGIGTQAIGLAALGYSVTGSDISHMELAEAKKRAENLNVNIELKTADFRALDKVFDDKYDILIAMDNALPHMLTENDLKEAIKSIVNQLKEGGIFVASIRDYDGLLEDKPPYSPPYIHGTEKGQKVAFQTWHWHDDHYKLIQYIIEDEDTLEISKFQCEYRATCREEITKILYDEGCTYVKWMFPEESGFYQPIVVAKK